MTVSRTSSLFDNPKRSATRASRASTSAGRRKLAGEFVFILASNYNPTTSDFMAPPRNWTEGSSNCGNQCRVAAPLRRGRNLRQSVGRYRKLGAEWKHECNGHLYAHVGSTAVAARILPPRRSTLGGRAPRPDRPVHPRGGLERR